MEVITMESSVFKELTGQITELISCIREERKRWKDTVEGRKPPDYKMDSKEVCRALGISIRTLQRMRKNKVLGYSYAGRACRYDRAEIERYLRERYVEAESGQTYVPRKRKTGKELLRRGYELQKGDESQRGDELH